MGHRDPEGSEAALGGLVCVSEPAEGAAPGGSPDVNYGLWVIAVARVGSLRVKRKVPSVGDGEGGGGCAAWEETSHVCCGPKTALNEVF